MKIKVITVIGANGTIGSKVSGIFASFGDTKVYMVCREMKDANEAVKKAALSVRANSITNNLIPKTYEDLEECIKNSDLIFESVSENIETKKNVYTQIIPLIDSNKIIATGTSGLSINALSESFSDEIKPFFMGIHFYNPPYSMILCEAISSKYTDKGLFGKVKKYLENKLYRNVVEVKDSPAFLGNRIGFQFINETMKYAEVYKDNGGIDYIDAILGNFTGRSMPPLVTSDFVGLDVHKAIVDNIYLNTADYAHETFKMPIFAEKLIQENKLGRKSGCGLYKSVPHIDGTNTIHVYDIASNEYRQIEKFSFPFAKKMIKEFRIGCYENAFISLVKNNSTEASICLNFLIKYVIYSLFASKEVGFSIYSCDDVMATGFNWIPPLSVIDAFGGLLTFKKIIEDQRLDLNINIEELLKDVPESKYDYRPFLKAN